MVSPTSCFLFVAKFKLIFIRGMYVDENTSRPANVHV